MALRFIYALMLITILSGCVGLGTQSAMRTGDSTSVAAPHISMKQDPVERLEDKQRSEDVRRELKDEIVATSNVTRNQMSGLVTASVSKLGEIVKGVEANLSELLKVETNLNASARADIKSTIQMMADLRVELNNTLTISNKVADKMDSLVKVNAEMQTQLGDIKATMQGQAAGNVGWQNRLDQKLDNSVQTFVSRAGRDVNMLPKAAVDTMLGMAEKAVAMLAIFSGLFSLAICLAFRYSRKRANQRFEEEKAEREYTHELLMFALAHMSPDKANLIEQRLKFTRPS